MTPILRSPPNSPPRAPDARVLPRDARQKVFPNGTLIITNVQRQSDQGTYTCVARSTHGYMARANLEVLVMGEYRAGNEGERGEEAPAGRVGEIESVRF